MYTCAFLGAGINKETKSLSPAIHDKIGKYFVELYGEYAGWAHTVLFAADLKRFSDHLAVKSKGAKGNKQQLVKKEDSSGNAKMGEGDFKEELEEGKVKLKAGKVKLEEGKVKVSSTAAGKVKGKPAAGKVNAQSAASESRGKTAAGKGKVETIEALSVTKPKRRRKV